MQNDFGDMYMLADDNCQQKNEMKLFDLFCMRQGRLYKNHWPCAKS